MRRILFSMILAAATAPVASAQSAALPPLPALPAAPQAATQQPPAQPSLYPARMSIIDPKGVEARSGSTLKYHATSRLSYGDTVIVLRESKDDPNWFAIAPPPGSFSWIDARNVLQVDRRQGVVIAEGNGSVGVLPGSSLVKEAPNTESARVASGTVVLLLRDQPMEADGKKYWAIMPVGTEARFIPKDAVQRAQAASVSPPDWTRPTAGGSTDWRVPGQLIGSPQNPGVATPASLSQAAKDWSPFNGVSTQPAQWSQWGKLRRTAFEKDGQLMYVLEDRQGRPLLYVTTTAGTTLQGYVEKTVCLYGSISYRSDGYQRTYYMVASHVATP